MTPYGHAPSWEKFSTLGKNPAEVPHGVLQKIIKEIPDKNATKIANEIVSSGVDIPKIVRIVKNTSLYKIVPKGTIPSRNTPFWITKNELQNILSAGKLEQLLGLPLSSTSLEYELYEIYILLFGHYFPCIVFHFSYGSRHHFRFFLQQSHGHFLCFFILPRFVI